jgi:hypothetical protein
MVYYRRYKIFYFRDVASGGYCVTDIGNEVKERRSYNIYSLVDKPSNSDSDSDARLGPGARWEVNLVLWISVGSSTPLLIGRAATGAMAAPLAARMNAT